MGRQIVWAEQQRRHHIAHQLGPCHLHRAQGAGIDPVQARANSPQGID